MATEPAKEQSRFYCHCGKSFIRKEHLRRHESSHAAPAFVCQVCQRSFTRNDLLRRHVALHGDKGPPTPRRAKACNACHESKVKCDGGERCSLCAKRGLTCSYDRDGQVANSAHSSEQDVSMSGSALPSDASQAKDAEEAERGLTTMVGLLKNGIQVPTRVGLPAELREHKNWWERCFERYRLGFHNHWPILHLPTIQDYPRDMIWVEATIVMVATWATYGPDSSHRDHTLEIHELMIATSLGVLMDSSMDDDIESQRWPWELWCVALINVVFALETGRAGLIRRADRVFDMILTDCRQRRVFDPQAVRRHQQVHIPGEFPPWVMKTTNQFYQIAAAMFKIDTCLSLAGNRPPRIRREELAVPLPTPFTHWNGYHLGSHFERAPHVQTDRSKYTISQLLRLPSLDIAVFYEDLQLILCQAVQCTWQLAQTRHTDSQLLGSIETLQPMDIKRRLIVCCKEIRRQSRAIRDDSTDPDLKRLLLWTYTGKEEPDDPDLEEVVTARILSVNVSTLMLQCLANMNLHAQVEQLKTELLQLNTKSGDMSSATDETAAWAHSPDGRLAFLHAMATLIHHDKTSPVQFAVHSDICAALAVTTAAVIILSWLTATLRDDQAQAWGSGSADLKMNWIREASELPEEVVEWAEVGSPLAAIDGWRLSQVAHGLLLERVYGKMHVLRKQWPLCEPVAAALEAKVRESR